MVISFVTCWLCCVSGCEVLPMDPTYITTYSDNTYPEGSTASQSCDGDGGFVVPAGSSETNTRTCTRSGWSDSDIMCESKCHVHNVHACVCPLLMMHGMTWHFWMVVEGLSCWIMLHLLKVQSFWESNWPLTNHKPRSKVID